MEAKSLHAAPHLCSTNLQWNPTSKLRSIKDCSNFLNCKNSGTPLRSLRGRQCRVRNNNIALVKSSLSTFVSKCVRKCEKIHTGKSADQKFYSSSVSFFRICGKLNHLGTQTTNDKCSAIIETLISLAEGFQGTLQKYYGNDSTRVLLVKSFRRLTALVLVFLALSLLPHRALKRHAFAAPIASSVSNENNIQKKELNDKDNDISLYKKELLSTVNLLEQRLQELSALDKDKTNAKVQNQVQKLEQALEIIRAKSRNLRGKALIDMEAAVARMKREEAGLIKQAEKIVESYSVARAELEKLSKQAEGDERMQKMREKRENDVRDAENRFRDIWSKLSKLEADLLVKETHGLRVAFQELPGIEEQSENKVNEYFQQRSRRTYEREYEGYTKESIVARIEKDLENAGKKAWEQRFLPSAVDMEEPQLPVDEETRKLMESIKIESQMSRQLQEQLDNLVRNRFKEDGEERLLLVKTPEEAVVKGLPPVELKWMFGDKEAHIPGAASLQMAQGWKQWREEAKADLKKSLLENVEKGKQYVAERQERILLYRDRVLAKTWYNENEKRWEMAPVAASYAVSKQLLGRARIRHDWAVMYVALKGDDREYYVDIQEFDALFEKVGGFDGLYVKMVTSGIPTTIEFMWIPFKEWELSQRLFFPFEFCYFTFLQIWESKAISGVVQWYFGKVNHIIEEFMVRIGFPLVELIIPKQVRMALGMAWPEAAEEAVGSTWFLEWQMQTEKNVQAREKQGSTFISWLSGFPFRCFFYGYPLVVVFQFVCRVVYKILGGRDLPETPLQAKKKKVQSLSKDLRPGTKQREIDPIKAAFDRMKRVKNPPVRLKDFAGIDAVKEEVNEIVTFLKNPKSFQEMGARAPRGVLIAGDSGTGKTTLAFAIAAEAKVPLVELCALDLEGGSWVGQGASNVRELFQTARELAPLIIFMDDFDLFAGIRGETVDTKMQDHEALINQLLVELDGFETQEGVVMIATTRRPEAIDDALRRPGRMDRTISLPIPNERERELMLRFAAKGTMHGDLVDFVDWQKVAEKTAGLTPAQLKFVPQSLECSAFTTKYCDDEELFGIYGWLATIGRITPHWLKYSKWMKMIDEGLIDHLCLRLTKEDIESTVELMEPYGQIRPGLELRNPPTIWTREAKFPHAVWAAGRGLVAALLPNFDSVDQIWLDPFSWEGIGYTKLTRQTAGGMKDAQAITRSYLEKQLVLRFGSHVAARLLLPFEESNNLSTSEIEEAQEIATKMVLAFGWGPDDSPMVYMTSKSQISLDMGKDHEFELEAKIEKLFYIACDKAADLLQKNRRALDAIVEHLLEYDIVTKQEMSRILEENGAIQEQDPFMLITHTKYGVLAGSSTNGTGRVSGTSLPATSGV
eukprot:Gb_28496 [translate_table: standard]